jgi:chemotaxis protein CheX
MIIGTAPDEALVEAAVAQVWDALLSSSPERWPDDRTPSFGNGIQAQIELRGHWNGRLVLRCESEVATRIAAAMLDVEPGETVSEDDVHDAVGEVINVVGGSVKGALGGTMSLGLPGVLPASTAPDLEQGFVVSWCGAPVFVQVVPDEAEPTG